MGGRNTNGKKEARFRRRSRLTMIAAVKMIVTITSLKTTITMTSMKRIATIIMTKRITRRSRR